MSTEKTTYQYPEKGDEAVNAIPQQLFMQLPKMLREPCLRFTDREERELFLLGALSVISGMLPRYMGNYFGNSLGTNLYCFVIGRYGTGKGALKWARMLGEPVHQHLLSCAKEEAKQYTADVAHHRRQMKVYDKGKLAEPPAEPLPPRHLKLFIPGNITKTAIMQLLQENNGSAIIFETEGDTLADMLRQDYGNFSDILRKAFHHEPISFFRRANNEDVDVPAPALSVILSGTYDQLLKLIPSVDNGLYSRFCFYMLEGNDEFRNPFSKEDANHGYYMQQYGNKFLDLYLELSKRTDDLKFVLSERQQKAFVQFFADIKEWTQETVSEEMDGSINRMAVMCCRVAMILSILRSYEHSPQLHPISIQCEDTDMVNAMTIMQKYGYYTTSVYNYLQKHGSKRAQNMTGQEPTDDERLLCYRLHQQNMSLRKIAIEVYDDDRKYMKVKRLLKRYYGIDSTAKK